MISKTIIKQIIDTWLEDIKDLQIVEREEARVLEKYLSFPQITAISGVRRSGKTYLMFQLIQKLLKNKENSICYINFEDERFNSNPEQLSLIYQTFLEHKNPKGKIHFFLDEIHLIEKWSKWLSRMYEKNIKFYVSGSNASLLSNDYSQALTGRHKLIKIFPLSFKQFLKYKNKKLISKPSFSIEYLAKINSLFDEYLKNGGFPEVVFDSRKEVLPDYFNDIITKDIIMRKNLRYKQSLKEIGIFLMTNISRYHSLYSLNKIIKARSINTIKNYLSYLQEAFLFFKIPIYSFSLKKQLANPFKIYAVDIGLRNSIAFEFSKDKGWLYENLAALQLIRNYQKENIYYWKNNRGWEVDFVVKGGLKIKSLIQVCANLNEENRKRETRSLIKASKELKCSNLIILTDDFEEEEKIKGKLIRYIPLYRWLLA